ncbi:hypothetical protein QTP88_028809 [Uroleucon formosanum]
MPESDILDITSQYETASKITKIEYHSYTPYTTSFNNNDEIRISIQQTDVDPYLHESFIFLEGMFSEADKVKLSNNGYSYLFEQIRLEINGIEVDSTRVLGITSALKGYLSGTPDNYNCYENSGWNFKNATQSANDKGEFSACIPLKYWLGFFEDFRKILVNSILELILTRSHSDLNALSLKSGILLLQPKSFETFEYPTLGTAKKVVWNLKTASKLEKPRFIIIGLQKGRKKSFTKDCSIFDHCNLTNVRVFLNSIAYPYDNLNLDFTKNNFTLLYDMYTSFQESYYEKSIRNPILSPSTFLSNAPIIVIDTSKQNDSATASAVDVQLEIEASESLTDVTAYCLLIHDRIVEYVPFTRENSKKPKITMKAKTKKQKLIMVNTSDQNSDDEENDVYTPIPILLYNNNLRMNNSDMGNTNKRHRLSGSEYRKRRAAAQAEIAKQSGLMLKFFKSEHNDTVESKVIDEDLEVTDFNLKNENPDDNLNLEIDNMKDNDGTVESEVNDEDVRSEDTDFNSKMDNSDDNLNLDVEIIKDPAKWPEINDKMKLLLVKNNPLQINLKYYPFDDYKRKFSNAHYFKTLSNGEKLNRTWLIYSESSDSVFCFCCKLFKKDISSLSKQGTRDWKNISQILKRHENSPNHKIAYEDWKVLQTRMMQGKTIDDENQTLIRKETKHWKAVIERIISLIQTLGMQNLALRGSSDKLYEFDNGNFLKFIELLGKFDPIIKEHISRVTSQDIHTHYLGKNIQNEIIQLLDNKIRQKIISAVQNSKYYSIILDCTPDVSHKEQMTMIIRFVTSTEKKENVPAKVSISEHFLTFIELHDTTGLNMTHVLLETLKKYGILLDDMRGQGYDNGANMRGQQNGVQARVRQLNRRAFYVPCNAHSLNLVLNDSANCCLGAVIFFNIIQEVYVFFSASTHQWNVLLKHINNLTVKPLSGTRWESRLDAVPAIRFQIKEIYSALLEISQDNLLVNPSGVKSRAEAIGIINKFLNFKFLCCLVVWYDILFEINITSKMLQSISLDVSETVKQLDSTKYFLMRYRSDEGFENTLKSAKLLANELGIEDSFPSIDQSRTRRTKTQFNYESCDDPIIDSKQRFKEEFFNAILDRAIQSINERFLQLSEHANLF